MKRLCKVLIICFITLSCNSDDDSNQFKNFCLVNDPIDDLGWLKAEIEQREQNITEFSKYQYISQSIYKGESVIIDANCDPFSNSVFIVFNCKGENIGFIGDENFPFEVLTNGQVIWKTEDSVCSF